MNFTFSEIEGENPVTKWMEAKLAEFVRRKYGMEVRVSFQLIDCSESECAAVKSMEIKEGRMWCRTK